MGVVDGRGVGTDMRAETPAATGDEERRVSEGWWRVVKVYEKK